MFGPQLIEYFGMDKEVWPCWRRYVTGGRLWSFKSPHQSQLAFSLSCDLVSRCELLRCLLLSTMPACLPPCSPKDSHGLTLSNCNPPINSFFHKLLWSWCLITAIETQTKMPASPKLSLVGETRWEGPAPLSLSPSYLKLHVFSILSNSIATAIAINTTFPSFLFF